MATNENVTKLLMWWAAGFAIGVASTSMFLLSWVYACTGGTR